MKMTKGQGISFFAVIVLFAVLSMMLFILPVDKKITFWMGYVFLAYALIIVLVTHFKFFNKQVKEERFMNVPVVVVSWIYLIVQGVLSFFEITRQFLSYGTMLLLNLVIALVFTVLILAIAASADRIERNAEAVVDKILFREVLKNELKMIKCDDAKLNSKIKDLTEEVTYSDPMSHSKLSEIEDNIFNKVKELSSEISDKESAFKLCDEISDLLKNRNNQCVTLKRVKDKDALKEPSTGGGKIAVVGIGAALIIVLAVEVLVMYVIPNTQYKEACELMDNNKYEEALILFEDLGEYKDSKDKINNIYEILYQEKYNAAENAFSAGNYDEALSLYKEVIDYKDSKDKIIEIKNRLSSDDIMYLGFYDNEPIAWKMVEFHGYNEVLLLADESVRNLPVSDDIADVSYDNSDIAKWLSGEFTEQFTDRDISKIIETDGYKAFLLSEEDVNRLRNSGVDLSSDSDWWIRTETNKGFKYVTKEGNVADGGDIHLRDKGVRPAVWISLR